MRQNSCTQCVYFKFQAGQTYKRAWGHTVQGGSHGSQQEERLHLKVCRCAFMQECWNWSKSDELCPLNCSDPICWQRWWEAFIKSPMEHKNKHWRTSEEDPTFQWLTRVHTEKWWSQQSVGLKIYSTVQETSPEFQQVSLAPMVTFDPEDLEVMVLLLPLVPFDGFACSDAGPPVWSNRVEVTAGH